MMSKKILMQRELVFLESLGFTVLRFWSNEVLGNTDAVLNEILRA